MATNHPLLIGPNYTIENSLYEVMTNNPYYTCQVTIGQHKITKADREATASLCHETGQRLYIHTHLHTNLAKIDARNSLRSLKNDLAIIRNIPGAVVLHVGKACDQTPKGHKMSCLSHDQALTEVIRRLNTLEPYIRTNDSPFLLLENAAGQGTELGSNWDDFRRLGEGLDKVHRYLGLCLDTQHAFAAGLTRWSTYQETNQALDEAAATGFPVGLIHLNDSLVPYNSRKDRHGSIGNGCIWSNKETHQGLIELLARCAEEKIGLILETPTQLDDLNYIYSNFVAAD